MQVTRINRNGEKNTKNISYILQFINSARFMASSLSNLVNNLSERVHRIVNTNMTIKNIKLAELNKDCDCFLEYTNFKYNLTEYKCLCRNKNYQY